MRAAAQVSPSCDGHASVVLSAVFSPDGRRVVTAGGDDGTARIWDARSGASLAVLDHTDEVESAVFSPDGTRVVTAGGTGTARIWDAASGTSLAVLDD